MVMKKLSLGLVVVGLIALLAIPAFANSNLMMFGSEGSSSSLQAEGTTTTRYASDSRHFCWGSDCDRNSGCEYNDEGNHHRFMDCERYEDCCYKNCNNNERGNGCFEGQGQDCRQGEDCRHGQDCRHAEDCRQDEECNQGFCFSLGHSRCCD